MYGEFRPVLVYGVAAPNDWSYSLDGIKGITEFAGETSKGYGFDLVYGVEIELKDYKIKSFKHVDILAESIGKQADYYLCLEGDYEIGDSKNKKSFDKETVKKVSESYEQYKGSQHHSLNKSASDS